jgi:hypothetical protein
MSSAFFNESGLAKLEPHRRINDSLAVRRAEVMLSDVEGLQLAAGTFLDLIPGHMNSRLAGAGAAKSATGISHDAAGPQAFMKRTPNHAASRHQD